MTKWDGMSDCLHCGHEARAHDFSDQKRGCLRCWLVRQKDVFSSMCIDYLA